MLLLPLKYENTLLHRVAIKLLKPIALSKTLLVRLSHLISASIPSLKGQCALSHSRARLQRWTPFKVSGNEFQNK